MTSGLSCFAQKAEKKFGTQSATSSTKQDQFPGSRADIGDSDNESDEEESDEEHDVDDNTDGIKAIFTGVDDTADQDDQVFTLKRRNVDVEPMPLEPEEGLVTIIQTHFTKKN